jgi:protein-tyrosine kinase
MSRVHDALRRSELTGTPGNASGRRGPEVPFGSSLPPTAGPVVLPAIDGPLAASGSESGTVISPAILDGVREIPFDPAPESHLISAQSSQSSPGEEFRTLRTRLTHLQSIHPLHTVVVTSPSPAEGKTFTSVNLALAQAQIPENMVLLADFDLRRPAIHDLLQTERSPGFADFLLGEVTLSQAMRKLKGLNLYFLPAGTPVKNPLELLNLKTVRTFVEELPRSFHWAVFDTPPLLFSADANLLATLADGTILVVKIGSTTFESVTRAMQSLCENNVLGIVANGARAGELYSKYAHYYSRPE